MAKKRNRKIVKYRKPFQINIGIIVFAIIFLYLLYYVFTYFTTEHISVYEVTQGSIAQNTIFEGLILRDETVYYTTDSGYINYYCKDASKANAGSYIYSVDATGNFYNQMTENNNGQLQISDDGYSQLEEVANQYLSGYSNENFRQVYQFKYDIEGALVEILNSGTRSELGAAAAGNRGLHVHRADASGVVVYNTDGMEAVTEDTFTADMFDTYAYQKENLLKRQTVSSGDVAYKMIQSEYWKVVIPIDNILAEELAQEQNIKVKFNKDHSQVWATSHIITRDGAPYLILEFNNSMIRFSKDRYVELELLLTDTSGLKIPNTAFVEKQFITIPKDYITKGGDSDDDGILLVQTDKEGAETITFTRVTLFYENEDVYYIDSENIVLGDVVVKPDSNERYTLKETNPLEGVYNINKGYAVFKRVEKLFENEEYTIIKSGTSYGIALYDHIALDASVVKEDDIIH